MAGVGVSFARLSVMSEPICITHLDFERLSKVIERASSRFDVGIVELLDRQLSAALIVHSLDVPPDVVAMNSRVRYTGELDRLPSMRLRIDHVSYQPEASGHFDL